MSKTSSLPESVVYEILANPRRRATIRHLTTTASGRTVSLRDLATAIAAAETGQSPPPRASRESVYNSLHQTHLPKLDELGVVASLAAVPVFGTVDPLFWAIGFLSLFALSALYRLWSIRWCLRGTLSRKAAE